MQDTITFKAKLGDEIRRFSVPASSEWKDVSGKICSIFSIASNERVIVKYEDDEKELVTIDSTAELQEMKRMYGSQCVRLDISKVIASSPAPQSSSSSDNLNNTNNNNNNNEFGRSWRSSGRGRKEWKRKQCEMSREELNEKLKILEDKGYKCKWRNCKMLKMHNGDVDKVCEAFMEHKNRKCKYSAALQQLQEKGFNERMINFRLLKKYDGDVDKVIDILTKAQKFRDVGCCKWQVYRLLDKYDGNMEEVEKIWQKKREKFEKKAQRRREKEVNKYECKWKGRCGRGKNKGECSPASSGCSSPSSGGSLSDCCDKTTEKS